jgi:hypothetical protein
MSDDDLIRRGEVLELLEEEGWVGNSRRQIERMMPAPRATQAMKRKRPARTEPDGANG